MAALAFAGYNTSIGYNDASGAVSTRVAIAPTSASHLVVSNLSTTIPIHVHLGDVTVVAVIPAGGNWASGHVAPGGDVTIAIGDATHIAFISSAAASYSMSAVIPTAR